MVSSMLLAVIICILATRSEAVEEVNRPGYCRDVVCQEPFSPSNCPEDSMYVSGVSQEGCCGACVRYMGLDDIGCTDSLSRNTTIDEITRNAIEEQKHTNEQNVILSSLCARHLQCLNETCIMEENDEVAPGCRVLQSLYDQAMLNIEDDWKKEYRWRPSCTTDGYYQPKQCKGTTSYNAPEKLCLCVDEEGNTIEGKAFYFQTDLYNDMNCLCSREVWRRKENGEAVVTLHCLENGNYEELQCEDGWCFCVQPEDGRATGMKVPQKSMKILPCFNKTLNGDYYERQCESELNAFKYIESTLHQHNFNPIVSANVSCSLDGSYSGKQCSTHNGWDQCFCYDRYYEKISEETAGDNCNCRRDSMILSPQPQCTPTTGVYYPIQSRSSGDLGSINYCVDNDGVRIGPKILEKYETYLNCTESERCMKGEEEGCEKACFDKEKGACPDEAYYFYLISSSVNNDDNDYNNDNNNNIKNHNTNSNKNNNNSNNNNNNNSNNDVNYINDDNNNNDNPSSNNIKNNNHNGNNINQ